MFHFRNRRLFAWILTVLTLTVLFASCEEEKEPVDDRPPLEMTDGQAKEVLAPLIENAYPINEIFFGKGLPYDGELNKEYKMVSAQYLPVSESAGYHTVAEIKEAAEKVYSKKYLDSIYPVMFEGLTLNEEDELTMSTIDPRYKEFKETDGEETRTVLKVNALHEGYDLKTVPDASTAAVVECTPDYVKVSVSYTLDGKTGTMFLTLSPDENGVWLLDSPTY